LDVISRRSIITGLISLVAAPAIVRAGSLMPVKVMAPTPALGDLKWWSGSVSHFYAEIIPPTINGRPLYKPDGSPVRGGDLVSGQAVVVVFDGAQWVMLGG
jgi:hypothetical protein